MSASRELATTVQPQQVSLASAGDLQLMLPIIGNQITAIAFHPVDDDSVMPLVPNGHQANGSLIARGLGEVFPQSGPEYYVMGETPRSGPALGMMDIGAPAGTFIYSPVDGTVAAIKNYQIRGQCTDTEIKIQPNSQSRLLVILTHVDQAQVSLGQPLRAGYTRLGSVRALDGCIEQPLSGVTYDNGNHLQMQVDSTK